jgi:aminoglycoside 3-N-acetyltransferase
MKRKLSENDFRSVLDEVIGPEDKNIAIFSGIYTFAHRFVWPHREVPDRLLDVLEDFIGSDRTLIVPAYNISFPGTRVFDTVLSRTDIGALPDCAVKRSTFRRLMKPLNSYMAKGPKAEEFLDLPCSTAWGEDGALAWLVKTNAKILILGVPWHEACSLYHYAEERLKVPYRYYKRFRGDLRRNGVSIGECEEVMYSRSFNVPPEWDHGRIYPRLLDAGAITSAKHPDIPLEAANASQIFNVTSEMLEADPYAYITNVEAVKDWVDNGKESEMATLTETERCED